MTRHDIPDHDANASPAVPAARRPMTLVRPLLVAVGVVVVLLLFWHLRQVALLLFGGIIGATVLDALARRLQTHLRMSRLWAVVSCLLVLTAMFLLGGYLIGDRLAGQLADLRERLPVALGALRDWLAAHPPGPRLLRLWDSVQNDMPWGRVLSAAGLTFGALGNAFLMAIIGIYLAVDPTLYLDGVVRLVPPRHRAPLRNALVSSGRGLGGWLLGQGLSMLFVGVTTAVGLMLLDVPLAFSLGVIAALLDFVPFFGPIVSGALAVLVAFSEGPQTALSVALLALAIQQVEGNLVVPLVQRWAVQLPPALGVLSVLVFGVLFGPLGIVFGTPLMVVLMILVRKLYVEDLLEGGDGAAGGRG